MRFVSATNRDLEAEITAGTFRRDLFFRLNGIALVIPPLRERQAEIEPLARAFVARAAQAANRPPPRISPAALAVLQNYTWPGNIRELHNVIERAVVLSDGDEIAFDQLPVDKMDLTPAHLRSAPAEPGSGALRGELEALEHQRIVDALAASAGNQSHAARLLGISRGALLARLQRYGVQRPRGNRKAE